MQTLAVGEQQSADPISGARLYADVERYAAFGVHRFGTNADRQTTDWMARKLERAGFKIELQPFSLGKQYFLEHASVTVGSATLEALPFWWIPERLASFSLAAPLAAEGDASGKLVWVKLPYDRTAYLSDDHRGAIRAAAERAPAAIILATTGPQALEVVARVFAAAITDVAQQHDAAFH